MVKVERENEQKANIAIRYKKECFPFYILMLENAQETQTRYTASITRAIYNAPTVQLGQTERKI